MNVCLAGRRVENLSQKQLAKRSDWESCGGDSESGQSSQKPWFCNPFSIVDDARDNVDCIDGLYVMTVTWIPFAFIGRHECTYSDQTFAFVSGEPPHSIVIGAAIAVLSGRSYCTIS